MKRSLDRDLYLWKNDPHRVPLLVRGARQVGKTFAIEHFGNTHFDQLVTINFERDKKFHALFDLDLKPLRLLRSLEELTQVAIVPNKTLLFFDEIQSCPRAIMSLRYFKEELPELHVIGAGSLLEFSLQANSFSFPVGRVEFRYMYPLSFGEFLEAAGEEISRMRLEEISLNNPPSTSLHTHLCERVRDYALCGGMPDAVQAFLHSHSFVDVKKIHQRLLDTYRSDFGKYSSLTQRKYLETCFEKAPLLIGSFIKYSKISADFASRDLKAALHLLETAGLLCPIHPLTTALHSKKLKILFLDIGLLQEFFQDTRLLHIDQGPLAEQFVGQELLVNTPSYQKKKLFFWEKEKRGSEAEVDYVIEYEKNLIPVEVKAGKSTKMRSLKIFMEERKSPFGIHISQNPLSFENGIVSIPPYLIAQLPQIIEKC